MSYDISISVKGEGVDRYFEIAEPTHANPTYNLRDMFVACMDWDYTQGNIYKCLEIIGNINRGIDELRHNRSEYEKYNPKNGWGNIDNALETLESLQDCIYRVSAEIPIEYLYMRW